MTEELRTFAPVYCPLCRGMLVLKGFLKIEEVAVLAEHLPSECLNSGKRYRLELPRIQAEVIGEVID